MLRKLRKMEFKLRVERSFSQNWTRVPNNFGSARRKLVS